MPSLIRGRRLALAVVPLLLWYPLLLDAQVPSAPRDSTARRDSIARLQAVTVVAGPTERAQPVSVLRIDAATIRSTPARSTYELLRQAAGVEVHEQGQGPGFASDASLRGFSSDHATDLATWIDGVPLNEPVNAHAEGYNDLSVLFPGGIQDIEVLRGPASALFGNFALAGVLNVRTLERMRGTDATLTGGSFGRVDAMLLTGFDHGDAGGGVLGGRFARETGFRPNAGYSIEQGHARLVHDLSPALRIDGGIELYGGNWNSPGFLSEDEFANHRYDIVSNATDGGVKRRAQERVSLRLLTDAMLWRTTLYSTQSRWQLFLTIPPAGGRFEGTGSQTEEEDVRAGLGATSALTLSRDRGTITAGAETRWDRSSYENYFTTDRARDSVAIVLEGRQLAGALFVQSHLDVTERWRVDAGLRYDALATRSLPDGGDASSATHRVLSPKVGGSVRMSSIASLYTNLSRGFRSANGVIEDPTLQPITEWAYETGVKVDQGGRSASVALFRMDVSNEQTLNPVTLVSTSGGASRRQGVDLDWHLALSPRVATSGNWTITDARYRTRTASPEAGGGDPVVLDGQRVFNTARYVGSTALDLTPGVFGVRLRVSGNWVGPYSPFDEPGVVVGGYGLLHASAAFPSDRFDVAIALRNLLDRAYPELIAGRIVSPGQPRTVSLTLRLHERAR